jgi:clan AA aspartic protease
MNTGVVNAQLEACLRVRLRGPSGQILRVNAVIDTGYNGSLTLPPALIAQLGLPWHRRGRAILADGSASVYDIYAGIVVWERRQRAIPIDEVNTTPLVGTALLAGHQLTADFRPPGKVTIKRLSSRR